MSNKPAEARSVVVVHKTSGAARRTWRRLLPASCVSILAHGALLLLFLLLSPLIHADLQPEPRWLPDVIQADPVEDQDKDLITFSTIEVNLGSLEREAETQYAGKRPDEVSVPGAQNPAEVVGLRDGIKGAEPVTIPPPGGYGSRGDGGAREAFGPGNSRVGGDGGGFNPFGMPLQPGGPPGNSGAGRFDIYKEGGSTASEAAVARALKWIARQQLPDGRWMLNSPTLPQADRGTESNDVAATALGLLPILATGKTHKPAARNEYDKVVAKGLKFLLSRQDRKTGYFGAGMYAHGLATITLCEAYALSHDSALRRPAQQAINLIVRTQHEAGGWRYGPSKQPGDLSVTGWQVMALKSAQMAGLDVPQVTLRRAVAFLDSCARPDEGYGYLPGGQAKSSMTAVGLLCRQYVQQWGSAHPRVIKSVDKYIKPNRPSRPDVYYYYYATQVMHRFGGDAWKAWNVEMRESLIAKQEKSTTSANFGSWSPAGDPWARAGGRLMMTSLNVLTLEVYYRYLPLYYRDAAVAKER